MAITMKKLKKSLNETIFMRYAIGKCSETDLIRSLLKPCVAWIPEQEYKYE
jgi:hypothetical protein